MAESYAPKIKVSGGSSGGNIKVSGIKVPKPRKPKSVQLPQFGSSLPEPSDLLGYTQIAPADEQRLATALAPFREAKAKGELSKEEQEKQEGITDIAKKPLKWLWSGLQFVGQLASAPQRILGGVAEDALGGDPGFSVKNRMGDLLAAWGDPEAGATPGEVLSQMRDRAVMGESKGAGGFIDHLLAGKYSSVAAAVGIAPAATVFSPPAYQSQVKTGDPGWAGKAQGLIADIAYDPLNVVGAGAVRGGVSALGKAAKFTAGTGTKVKHMNTMFQMSPEAAARLKPLFTHMDEAGRPVRALPAGTSGARGHWAYNPRHLSAGSPRVFASGKGGTYITSTPHAPRVSRPADFIGSVDKPPVAAVRPTYVRGPDGKITQIKWADEATPPSSSIPAGREAIEAAPPKAALGPAPPRAINAAPTFIGSVFGSKTWKRVTDAVPTFRAGRRTVKPTKAFTPPGVGEGTAKVANELVPRVVGDIVPASRDASTFVSAADGAVTPTERFAQLSKPPVAPPATPTDLVPRPRGEMQRVVSRAVNDPRPAMTFEKGSIPYIHNQRSLADALREGGVKQAIDEFGPDVWKEFYGTLSKREKASLHTTQGGIRVLGKTVVTGNKIGEYTGALSAFARRSDTMARALDELGRGMDKLSAAGNAMARRLHRAGVPFSDPVVSRGVSRAFTMRRGAYVGAKADIAYAANRTFETVLPVVEQLDGAGVRQLMWALHRRTDPEAWAALSPEVRQAAEQILALNDELYLYAAKRGVRYAKREDFGIPHVLEQARKEAKELAAVGQRTKGGGPGGATMRVAMTREHPDLLPGFDDLFTTDLRKAYFYYGNRLARDIADVETWNALRRVTDIHGNPIVLTYSDLGLSSKRMTKEGRVREVVDADYKVPDVGERKVESYVRHAEPDEQNRTIEQVLTDLGLVDITNIEGFRVPHGLDDIVVPRQVVKALENHTKLSAWTDGVMRHVMGTWKKWTLMPWPGYHIRNAISNLWLVASSGVEHNPRTFAKTMIDVMKGRIEPEYLEELRHYGLISPELRKSGAPRLGAPAGVGDVAQTVSEVDSKYGVMRAMKGAKTKLDKAKRFSPVELGTQFGASIENHARASLFVQARRNGESAEDALQMVRDYLFDYSELTPFERTVRNTAAPFYSWLRLNGALQLYLLSHHPAAYLKAANLPQNLSYVASSVDPDNELIPRYILQEGAYPVRVPSPLRFLTGGKETAAFAFDLPSQTLSDMARPATALAGGIPFSPVRSDPEGVAQPLSQFVGGTVSGPAAGIYTALTGMDLWRGRSVSPEPRPFPIGVPMAVRTGAIDEATGKPVRKVQTALPGQVYRGLESFFPGGRAIPMVAAASDPYAQEALPRRLASSMLGVRNMPLGLEASRTEARNQAEQLKRLQQDMLMHGKDIAIERPKARPKTPPWLAMNKRGRSRKPPWVTQAEQDKRKKQRVPA